MENERRKWEQVTDGTTSENMEVTDLRPVLQFLRFDGKVCVS